MTSETECFPMVLLEALSVGLPVISYDSPTGPKHILTNESDSFIVPYKNSAIFAERLKQLMSDENLRKQLGIHAKINAERFEISKVMAQWKDLFDNLITQP
ncbi:glycosyltransferase [Kaistella anthropi]|nr:glycosyltransferase [Kaistella anthropi]